MRRFRPIRAVVLGLLPLLIWLAVCMWVGSLGPFHSAPYGPYHFQYDPIEFIIWPALFMNGFRTGLILLTEHGWQMFLALTVEFSMVGLMLDLLRISRLTITG